jgi:cobyrinic acid a,c-diamide synthase
VGETGCRRALYVAAGAADLVLVEGVMGLFDAQPSGADLAERLDFPSPPRTAAALFGAET